MGNAGSNVFPPLQNVPSCDTARFMGTWFVIGVKPTYFETTCSNAVEKYSLVDEKKNYDIGIDFRYNAKDPITSKLKSLPQKGWVQGGNRANSGLWTVSPLWPVKMPYHIIELDEANYDHVVIGYPSREYCWIMSRRPKMKESTYESLKKKARRETSVRSQGPQESTANMDERRT
mmetsp:Transcript_37070/g.86483  ORF Transcript_37070/g.86483 Transcript_37070/m.86483 type:complete len:175 (-) Transcript_37070:135-659(-)